MIHTDIQVSCLTRLPRTKCHPCLTGLASVFGIPHQPLQHRTARRPGDRELSLRRLCSWPQAMNSRVCHGSGWGVHELGSQLEPLGDVEE